VIPTLILVGFVFGRWWRVTVPVTTVAWVTALILFGGGMSDDDFVPATALAIANLTVGVVVFQALALLVRLGSAVIRRMRRARY
jgi:hypothetical protein